MKSLEDKRNKNLNFNGKSMKAWQAQCEKQFTVSSDGKKLHHKRRTLQASEEENPYKRKRVRPATKEMLVVPNENVEEFVRHAHLGLTNPVRRSRASHFGRDKMMAELDSYWWRGKKKDIENWISHCPQCEEAKPAIVRNLQVKC
jgi:hypothetical protein